MFLNMGGEGIFNRVISSFKHSRDINNLVGDIAMFKMAEIFYKQKIESLFDGVYKTEKYQGFLETYAKQRFNEATVYPAGELYELIKFVADTKNKTIELWTLFLAAVCGGLVGALITLAFT